MDLLRRRRRFTEPETRFFMVQLIGVDGSVKVNRRTEPSPSNGNPNANPNEEGEEEDEEELEARQRKKELEQHKARIVAQMAPVKEEDGYDEQERDDEPEREREEEDEEMRMGEGREAPAVPPKPVYRDGHGRTGSTQYLQERENVAPSSTVRMVQPQAPSAKASGRVFRALRVNSDGDLVKSHLNNTDDQEDEVEDEKVFIYIMERLHGEYEFTYVDRERKKGMEWVRRYLRMKHVIVFKMSHDVLQFNFYDHSKLILSSRGQLVTHIDKHYRMTRWKLRDIMRFSLDRPSDADQEQLKFNQRLVDKLKHCKEVLASIKNASAGAEEEAMDVERPQQGRSEQGGQQGRGEQRAQQTTLGRSRHAGSKMSLR
ncbi:hypothetical protein MD484_g8520, partial [Candolleomyces efflorescens]